MKPSCLLGAVCVILFIPNLASAAVIALHSGDADPETEGWTKSAPGGGGGIVVGAVNDSGTLAWKIDDISFAGDSSYQYIDSVSAPVYTCCELLSCG